MNKAIFIAWDATIAKDVPYCSKQEDFVFLPTVFDGFRMVSITDYKVIIIANQSGIARGYFTDETLGNIHEKMRAEITREGGRIDAIYYCPHHPDDKCDCWKPKIGLLEKAAQEWNIALTESYLIGDKFHDMKTANNAGCKAVLIPSSEPELEELRGHNGFKGTIDFTSADFITAARWITRVKASIVIPAYEEENGLQVVLSKIVNMIDNDSEVIVIDDGSQDRTSEVASNFPCRVIKHEVNRGKGEALKTGVNIANSESVIFIDADNTYPAELIPQIIKDLETYDLVICSRIRGKEYIPAFNRIGNFVIRNLIRRIYGFKPKDPLTGLYAIKKEYFDEMGLISNRFGIESEIAIKATRMHLKMLDRPITYNKRIGKPKLNSYKAGAEILSTIFRFLFWKPSSK